MDRVFVVAIRRTVAAGVELYDHEYRQLYVTATSFGEAEQRALSHVPEGFEITDITKNNNGDMIVV